MLSFPEFEHDLIVQRTQEGKAIARQNADFRDGRPKKYSLVQLDHTLELLETHSYKQVERLTGISVTTIYRAKLESKQEAPASTRQQSAIKP
jgi:DNA invertase Pin-like site-specific DNA recombinase